MYSVVLMMAMTGGGDMPAGLHGGGCCGGGYGGCYGGGYGYSCGGGHGCHGGRSRGHGHKGGGCCGGGYAYGGYGCCGGGGGHGCHGGRSRGHGHKGGGCCGGGYGGCWGGNYGGCYGSGYGGCYGGGMGAGCMGGVGGAGCIGGQVAPVAPTTTPSTTPSTTTPKTTNLDNAAPATIVVNVPADARLTIDGEATTSTSTQRVFVSPTLNPGREYHYTLKAEFQKDGKMVSVTKDVAVKAGIETRVNLDAEGLAKVASR